ncbi:sec-independent translocase [Streptomyces alkaliterrae]|uniref:Sec-independent protein translocase protein TatB n=1 Tax=Streptomyces alkaliterrae TaxID=2213162 RepID=A0A5P0YPR4_9ACTN|nr:sec-independent translocase [Streptomyces alkaliterrae]MBB1255147.1 Sec-independent protein translocase subunit TatB [Streptomyces alkaliterrae]MBB1261353.1 Sec-independent protein translocase subunit TatB [Streptomyces alkaliterrae]MQS02354.1 Sec-independent protein translocase TatB [Streptomyces alkaliterrae]
MIFDFGAMELLVLIVLGMLLFGPEKLPKVISDVVSFIRKVRSFSDSARDDIRKELGPEFKDFEFQDLHPKRFAQKHLMDRDDLGLKELKEIRESLDLRKELSEVTDAVNGVGRQADGTPDVLRKPELPAADGAATAANGTPRADLTKRPQPPTAAFDPDAT